MSSPWPALRFVLLLGAGSFLIASLARSPLHPDARFFILATIASVAAWSARSGLLLLAARKERITLDTGAPTHRLALAAGMAALLALGAALLIASTPLPDRVAIVLAGITGAVLGVLMSTRDARPKGPRTASRLSWLLLDTALPAGVIAALTSTAIGTARFHAQGVVAPAEIARHLAATTFAYALLLGLGGFAKAFGEKKSGLVVARGKRTNTPSPILVGGAAGVMILFVGPHVLPPFQLVDVLILKAVVGLVGGGALSLMGALQGAEAAEVIAETRRTP